MTSLLNRLTGILEDKKNDLEMVLRLVDTEDTCEVPL